MKIAVVFDSMLWGGIEKVGISYIKIFKEVGYQVDAYILNPHTESIIDELKKQCNVQILDLKREDCPENSWHVALNHDLYGFEMCCLSIRYFWLVIKAWIKKRHYTIRDKKYDLAIAFSGHISDLTFVAENYIDARYKMAWVHGAQYQYNMISPGYFRLYKKIKNLVCLSDLCDAECEKFNKKNNIKKRKIYNPCIINSKKINEDKVKALKEQYGDFCLMVGRLARDKDQATVIRAIAILKSEFGIEKKLVLVGDGETRESLMVLADSLGIKDNIIFEGIQKNVQDYYSAAQIYTHAAPLEGLPTVFLEAMYYGLPIVSTDAVPGAEEILGNSEYGIICPVSNPHKLAENIKLLHMNEELRQNYIKKEFQRIRTFSPEKIKCDLESYFNEVGCGGVDDCLNWQKIYELRRKYDDFCLMVGRLAQDKKQETLIYAFNILKIKYGIDKKLVLLGDGSERERLNRIVSELKLEKNIIFEGNHPDIDNYYMAAYLYLHSSRLEGFGMVYVEAMNFSLPIVSTDAIPGAREILGNNDFGIICENDNPDMIAKIIFELYTNKKMYDCYSTKSYERSRDFNVNETKKKVLEYISDITKHV